MFKHTPNPPESETDSDSVSPYASTDSKKLHEAADRALDHYLNPAALKEAKTPRKPSTMFMVAPDMDTESLLANACESMASASVMLSDFADLLDGPHRNKLLGIQQVVMLGELAVNRALDNVDPQ
ncbi:hypothetical protein EB795_05465 [Pseudomonas mandelii]|uniref:DUF6124 family protein n=1 Tax=Pseudomonas mandelii TaxID=75612 RepID=UPI0012B3B9FE|nr:DUF6124 family protein [Pseudomonas mandelii]MSU93388.1 hypothetical protein [Pseudomonas mandelii]